MKENSLSWFSKNRWLLFVASIILMTVFSIGLQQVRMTSELRTILDEDHLGLAVIDEMEEHFDVPRSFIVFLSQEQNQLNTTTLQELDELTLSLEIGPYVSSVRSLPNSTFIESDQDNINTDYIYNRAFPIERSVADYKKIEQSIINDPTLVDSFISRDTQMSAIVVNTSLDQSAKTSQMQEVYNFILAETTSFNIDHQSYRIDISGELTFDLSQNQALNHDLAQNIGWSFLLIFILLLVIFRSLLAACFIFSISIFSCVSAIGFAGFMGIDINNVNITAPIIIIVIAVLDGIHFISVYQKRRNLEHFTAAIDSTIKLTYRPISLTTITTATGFIALNVSSSPAISSLGNITAVGICMAWLYTFGLLPSLAGLTKVKQQADNRDWIDNSLTFAFKLVIQHPKKIIAIFGVVSLLLLTQIPNIIIDDDPFNSLDDSLDYSVSQRFIRTQMHSNQFNLYFNTGTEGGIHSADFLSNVDRLAEWIKSQDKVLNAYSYVDHIKRINQIMNADNRNYYRTPESNALAAQYGLLYKLSIPSPDVLSRYTDLDEQRIILTVLTDEISRNELNTLIENIEQQSQRQGMADISRVTGWSAIFSQEIMTWVKELLQGFAVAFLLISLQMFIFFRSFKIGTISLIPNVLPIAITFGLWGIGRQPFDFVTLLVLSASFGLVIDDTIHFISKFFDRFNQSKNAREALEYAYRFSGRAIMITTIVLAIGLSPMLFSHLVSMQSITKLIAPIAFFALVTDLLLLPAILLLVYSRRSSTQDENTQSVKNLV